MTDIAAAAPRINVGWVVASTFKVILRRWRDLLIIGAAFVWLPNVLTAFAPDTIGSGGPALNLIAGLPGLIFTGAAALITYTELAGAARVTAGDAIRRAAGKFGALFGASFVANLAIILGLLLLIVPGVIAIVGWMAVPAVVVVENKTVGETLTRSWELSGGSRWRLAGLFGLGILGLAALLLGLVLLMAALTLAAGQDGATPIATFGVTPIWVLLVSIFTTVGPAAAYTGLRIAKEGDASDVSSVFA